MAQCSHCSAPLHGMICHYCGARNDINLQEIHEYTLSVPQSERICPVCHRALQTIDLHVNGTFFIERCSECFGLFFDRNELQSLIDIHIKNAHEVNYLKLQELQQQSYIKDTIVYRDCPVCRAPMQRRNYQKSSGVIVDVCHQHGTWLDSGELKRIYEWVKLGGMHRARGIDKEQQQHRVTLQKERSYRQRYDARHTNQSHHAQSDYNILLDILEYLFS